MPVLLHLPTEVLTLIVEEVCISAELENLGQTVTVELQCPPGDVVDEGVERHPSSNLQGDAPTVRYNGSRSDIRHQRDQLETLIVQRFGKQGIGRVISGSFLHGVDTSHKLESFDHSTQAKVNRLILNHRPSIRCLLALASTCRLLRAYAEPFLYRFADLDYGDPCAYTKHLELLLHYPHLTKYVRLLSFGNIYDERFEDWCGFLPQLSQAIDRLLAQDGPVSRDEMYRQLGPDRFGPHGLHPSIFRAMFLFLLPDVRSLKFDLAMHEDAGRAEQTRREWLFRALLKEPNDVWAAGKVPALRNLEEFSLVLRGDVRFNAFNPRLLLPFLFLPKMCTLYTSSLATAPYLTLSEHEGSEWSAKSPVTEMIFDFAAVDSLSLDSLLRLPRALERLTVNFSSVPSHAWNVCMAPHEAVNWPDADLAVGDAFLHQRHSLRKLAIRWSNALAGCSIRRLESFTVLEELTVPLRMVLSHRDGSLRSRRKSLPASIVRLELLAYDHIPVPNWQLEVLNLLDSKDALTPKLRQVRIEHWMKHSDGPASMYELEAEAIVSLARQAGVEVQVYFAEHKHYPETFSSDAGEEFESDDTEDD